MRQHHRIPDNGIPGNGRAIAALPANGLSAPARPCQRHPGSGFHNGGGEALPG